MGVYGRRVVMRSLDCQKNEAHPVSGRFPQCPGPPGVKPCGPGLRTAKCCRWRNADRPRESPVCQGPGALFLRPVRSSEPASKDQ